MYLKIKIEFFFINVSNISFTSNILKMLWKQIYIDSNYDYMTKGGMIN